MYEQEIRQVQFEERQMMRARQQTEQEEQAVHQRSLEVDLEQASMMLAPY